MARQGQRSTRWCSSRLGWALGYAFRQNLVRPEAKITVAILLHRFEMKASLNYIGYGSNVALIPNVSNLLTGLTQAYRTDITNSF